MLIPFCRDGLSLPVAPALLALLCQEAAQTPLDLVRCTQLTFNFRTPATAPTKAASIRLKSG